jgi:hypothetical protein
MGATKGAAGVNVEPYAVGDIVRFRDHRRRLVFPVEAQTEKISLKTADLLEHRFATRLTALSRHER